MDCRDKRHEGYGREREREIEGFNKVFVKCFLALPLIFAGPGARVQMENYIPYVKLFKSYKLS